MYNIKYKNLGINFLSLAITIIAIGILPVSWAKDNSNSNNKNINVNTNANNNANVNLNTNVNNANSNNNNQNTPDPVKQEQLRQKQEQLDSVRNKVNTYEKSSNVMEQKSETIVQIIALLEKKMQEAEVSLKQTGDSLNEVEKLVTAKEEEIFSKEKEINKRKVFLEQYVQELNLLDKKTIVEIMLEKPSFSDYFKEIENIATFEERLQELLGQLKTDKLTLTQEKDDLDEKKNEQVALYSMQEAQRVSLEQDRQDREELLKETQQEQGRLQDLIDKGSETASRLASEITALQSLGAKIDFGQALEEAKTVAGLTGVRAAFLLGVLKVESNMGNNVGGGRYTTDMNPAQWDKFKGICTELGYNPQDKPISRKPCYRNASGECSGWGGAMGPAQFMPTTWLGYKAAVASVTGHNPPDPWNLRDALTAMGLKLAKVEGVTSHDRTAEHKAASIYLAGGNWASFGWYGDRVLGYADTYEKSLE